MPFAMAEVDELLAAGVEKSVTLTRAEWEAINTVAATRLFISHDGWDRLVAEPREREVVDRLGAA
jgi:hypothetical protein